jgi:UDP-N-acetylglucosamine acyltransferase
MAYAHVAHDCKLGDRIILGNTTQLAGEVVVDDWAIVSGGTLVHQFCHLGAHIMVQGGSRITKDIPPYMMVGREPLSYMGLNIVGLRRRGFVAEQMNAIQESYRYVYLSGLNTTQALDAIEKNIPSSKEREDIVSFIRSSERGIIK